MGRANRPYTRLNQSRESFHTARGTARFSQTVTNTIEAGVAKTATWDVENPGAWSRVELDGLTTGAFVIDNPNSVRVLLKLNRSEGLLEITNIVAPTTGNTITIWIF